MREKDDGRDSKESETKQTTFEDWSWQVNNSVKEESDPSQHDNQPKESEEAAQSQNTKLDDFM